MSPLGFSEHLDETPVAAARLANGIARRTIFSGSGDLGAAGCPRHLIPVRTTPSLPGPIEKAKPAHYNLRLCLRIAEHAIVDIVDVAGPAEGHSLPRTLWPEQGSARHETKGIGYVPS